MTRISMKGANSGYVVRDGTRIAVGVVEPSRRADSAKPKRKAFVRVPVEWMDRLDKAKNAGTVKLALRLLYASWRQHGAAVKASNVMARMDKNVKWRALAELETLGLVKVERGNGRAPLVTLFADLPSREREG